MVVIPEEVMDDALVVVLLDIFKEELIESFLK
jgi:hypothetical protein